MIDETITVSIIVSTTLITIDEVKMFFTDIWTKKNPMTEQPCLLLIKW